MFILLMLQIVLLISQGIMQQEHEQEFLCLICNELILKPALLPCKHQFCCYCIRSIKYKHEDNQIKCPLCRRVTEWAPLNKQRQLEIIRSLLKRNNTRVFWGKGKTINDYDQNLTESRGFFYIMINDRFIGDIIWGEGSQHNSYVDEVGRASGRIIRLAGGDFQYEKGYLTRYSNTPTEDWSGIFRAKGDHTFILQKGRYDWHGWGCNSSGALLIQLKEILPGEQLNMYNTSMNPFKQIFQPQAEVAERVKYNCSQCKQDLLKPVILPCEHEICAFCIRSLNNKHPSKKVICPQCGCETQEVEFNVLREQQVINELIKTSNTRVFWGKASTINDYDENLTTSQGFFYILTDDVLKGDIVWGGGSVHNSYVGEVARVSGKVKLLDLGQFQFDQAYGAKYSNNPTEDWSGSFKKEGDSTFFLEKGRYTWHGWGGRVSSGTLKIELTELKPGDNLSLY